MEIINANQLKYKDEILSLILKIKKLDWAKEQLNGWLLLNLGTDIFNVWLVVDEDKPVGVLTAEVVEQESDPKVYISFCYVEPKLKGSVDRLLSKCEEWAKRINVKKLLVTTTKRNYRGFEKEHSFKLQRSILAKEI